MSTGGDLRDSVVRIIKIYPRPPTTERVDTLKTTKKRVLSSNSLISGPDKFPSLYTRYVYNLHKIISPQTPVFWFISYFNRTNTHLPDLRSAGGNRE